MGRTARTGPVVVGADRVVVAWRGRAGAGHRRGAAAPIPAGDASPLPKIPLRRRSTLTATLGVAPPGCTHGGSRDPVAVEPLDIPLGR